MSEQFTYRRPDGTDVVAMTFDLKPEHRFGQYQLMIEQMEGELMHLFEEIEAINLPATDTKPGWEAWRAKHRKEMRTYDELLDYAMVLEDAIQRRRTERQTALHLGGAAQMNAIERICERVLGGSLYCAVGQLTQPGAVVAQGMSDPSTN